MTWERARRALACGSCRAAIAVGEPLRRFRGALNPRCAECARVMTGEAPPPLDELPVDVPPHPSAVPTMTRIGGVQRTLPDFKNLGANDDK